MDLFKYFVVCCYFLGRGFDYVHTACTLCLNTDFGTPSPVYLQNGEFLVPNKTSSDIYLKRSETLLIACPGDKRHVVLANNSAHSNVVEAHCINNDTFRVDRWIGHFKDIRCNNQPWFTTEETGESCYQGGRVYRVGYQIQKRFHTLYEACFDQANAHTHYVKHHLSPGAMITQNGTRPQFIEGNLFGKVRMAELYKVKNQKEQLDDILGSGMADNYLTKKEFLTRGHLAARADFNLRAEQRASFHYINTAPQWFRGNAGDWAALEDAVRRRVDAQDSGLLIYTGTHGVLTLLDSGGNFRDIYLTADENNNPIVPVPMYYYKLVYDPKKRTAAAFVSINSSFFNKTITTRLTFCDAECSRHNWLKWRSNDGTFSFCCDYDDFVDKISYLPKLDVRGIFY
ncbi:uncharacterized protein LOC128681220 [Plodia interpunctella]|uniref:uncharacterized protein LOC128681220 n=1 Tax=Plodia interpunctella TaxID=58824 RepID=UPI0023680919|nr:uncharacterized protein LOC128681220 [Plodia interpunctella]